MRWCTRVLKILPFEAYVGEDHAYSYIGIRSDEDRDGYIAKKPPSLSERPNIIPVYPFKDDGLGLMDVKVLLEESALGLPDYYRWRIPIGLLFLFLPADRRMATSERRASREIRGSEEVRKGEW